MLAVNKINFVAFIAEVINCSAQTAKRTTEILVEQIQMLLGQTEGTAVMGDSFGKSKK